MFILSIKFGYPRKQYINKDSFRWFNINKENYNYFLSILFSYKIKNNVYYIKTRLLLSYNIIHSYSFKDNIKEFESVNVRIPSA